MNSFYWISIFWLTVSFSSCKEKTTDAGDTEKQEMPAALQDNKIDLKSYSRVSSNLIDELYNELEEKTPELKNLAAKIDEYKRKPDELKGTFYEYDNKSQMYYQSAGYKAKNIGDSLLAQEMRKMIETSENEYKVKTQSLKVLMERIEKNKTSIIDYSNMLKLVKTLPLIEKYQQDNLPGEKNYRQLIKEQEELLREIKALTK